MNDRSIPLSPSRPRGLEPTYPCLLPRDWVMAAALPIRQANAVKTLRGAREPAHLGRNRAAALKGQLINARRITPSTAEV